MKIRTIVLLLICMGLTVGCTKNDESTQEVKVSVISSDLIHITGDESFVNAIRQFLGSNGFDISQTPYTFGRDYTRNDVPQSKVESVREELRSLALTETRKVVDNVNNADVAKLVTDPQNTLGGASIVVTPIYIDREVSGLEVNKNISLPLLSGKTFVGTPTEEHRITRIVFNSESSVTITANGTDTDYQFTRRTTSLYVNSGDQTVLTFGFKSATQLTLTRINETSVGSKNYYFNLLVLP